MAKEEAQNSGSLVEENLALKESLYKTIAVLEDCRKFMAVSRHSLNTNVEISEALLSFMIARLDPILNNLYSNTPDYAFVNAVLAKLQNPNNYDDSVIDFVEIFDENGNLIASSLDESPE
ncbi:MAG: hypothetical protein M0R77_15015 [Gammaproteobacteria bacterium]|nr:hypothetical protein [Gammaproteobacteria bacterium]